MITDSFIGENISSPTKGAPSLSVLQYIAMQNGIDAIDLFRHGVQKNWRQQHGVEERTEHLDDTCFAHNDNKALENFRCNYGELTALTVDDLVGRCGGREEVFSVGSLVTSRSERLHIPMMNFHPEVRDPRSFILRSLAELRKRDPELIPPGVLVSSGRYYHYYGFRLIADKDLSRFLSYFLMPASLVSPRYVGHALYEGQCSLRLTNDAIFKPQLPVVDEFID